MRLVELSGCSRSIIPGEAGETRTCDRDSKTRGGIDPSDAMIEGVSDKKITDRIELRIKWGLKQEFNCRYLFFLPIPSTRNRYENARFLCGTDSSPRHQEQDRQPEPPLSQIHHPSIRS